MNQRITAAEMAEYLKPRKSKYGVRTDAQGKADRTYNGVLYDSKRECEYAKELDILKMAGKIRDWKRQVDYPLHVNGIKICTYRADFEVYDGFTSPRVIDIKGFLTPVARIKLLLVKAVYGITVEVVK